MKIALIGNTCRTKHRNYRDFNKTNRSQQQQYFNWRHTDDDSTRDKVDIR